MERLAAGDPGNAGFRAAMRLLVGGVVIVTTRLDGRAWGLTINAGTPKFVDDFCHR